MPPKNLTANSYGMWVKEEGKPRLERQLGHRVSLAQACQDCGAWWSDMTDDDKEAWKLKAKNYKSTAEFAKEKELYRSRRIYTKLENATNTGQSTTTVKPKTVKQKARTEEEDELSQIYYPREPPAAFLKKRNKDMKEISDNFDWVISPQLSEPEREQALQRRVFKLLSMTPFYEVPGDSSKAACSAIANCPPIYPPAEFTIISFSMANGITKVQHTLILTTDDTILTDERVKIDALADANREGGHKIPLFPTQEQKQKFCFQDDYLSLLKIIGDEMHNERFMYVLSSEYNQVLGGLQWMFNRSVAQGLSPKSIDPRMFACLEDLVTVLFNWAHHKKELPPNVDDELALVDPGNPYWSAFDETTLCPLHSQMWVNNCTTAKAKKTVFGFFEALQEEYNLTLTEAHKPTVNLRNKNGVEEAIFTGAGDAVLVGSSTGPSRRRLPDDCVSNASSKLHTFGGFSKHNHQRRVRTPVGAGRGKKAGAIAPVQDPDVSVESLFEVATKGQTQTFEAVLAEVEREFNNVPNHAENGSAEVSSAMLDDDIEFLDEVAPTDGLATKRVMPSQVAVSAGDNRGGPQPVTNPVLTSLAQPQQMPQCASSQHVPHISASSIGCSVVGMMARRRAEDNKTNGVGRGKQFGKKCLK